jgi:predicted NBD/HSP70 family sugar kinase
MVKAAPITESEAMNKRLNKAKGIFAAQAKNEPRSVEALRELARNMATGIAN